MPTYNYGQFPFADLILAQRIAYNVDGGAEYIGYAAPGSSDAAAAWMIAKLVYSGSSVVAKQWASGTNLQDKVWDNRESYSYS